jgi:hypothetical protein
MRYAQCQLSRAMRCRPTLAPRLVDERWRNIRAELFHTRLTDDDNSDGGKLTN